MEDRLFKLKPKQRKGSKPRCHWLTHGTREQVADRLTELVKPWGSVSADDHWMPEGFCQIEEAQLHKATKLLCHEERDRLSEWWLAVKSDESKTPNFDIASTYNVSGTKGILLVEAKAHTGEFLVQDSPKGSLFNLKRIEECIEETNVALAAQTTPGWALSHEHRYQISNRFAWSWKLTELGYPVILVYLGFLNAEEMRKREKQDPFANHAEWDSCVKSYSKRLIPVEIWNKPWTVQDRIFIPRICSREIGYQSPMEDN